MHLPTTNERFEILVEQLHRAKLANKARVTEFLKNGDSVGGIEYEKANEKHKDWGVVIGCIGGFGADFSSDSLLAIYRTDLTHLPMTDGT